MEKFILPDVWCCVATNHDEEKALSDYITENFETDCDYDPNPKGDCWYSNQKIKDYHYNYQNKPPTNCTEITFQQFKEYVLREKPTDNSDLEEIYKKLLA
jgi:hypothetical protein